MTPQAVSERPPVTVPKPMSSPFLQVPPSDWVASNELAFAIRDHAPVSRGHTLVISKRQVATYFAASLAEKTALWALVDEVKAALDAELRPDGYSVRFDAGEVAGQVMPPLARRPLRVRRAVPSKRVLAHRGGALPARRGDGSARVESGRRSARE